MGLFGKKFQRKFRNSVRRSRRVIGGASRHVRTLVGKADKLSGGALTAIINTNPYAAGAMGAITMASGNKHREKTARRFGSSGYHRPHPASSGDQMHAM